MFLTSMSREELYAEAHKDLIAISTKANMFIDKDTHHIRVITQYIVSRTPYDDAGACVRNMPNCLFLRRYGAFHRIGCEVQFPHNGIFIGIDAGNKFPR